MNDVFTSDHLIRFAHCDPAAIVYFPDFLDLAHSTMEDWLREGVGCALPDLIRQRRIGTPTVNLQCDFIKPVAMGEILRYELRVRKLGNASVVLEHRGVRAGTECLRLSQTIVFMNLDSQKAVPIPQDLRPRIERYLCTT